MASVEHFRIRRTGHVWPVNVGSVEHVRMSGKPDEYERVTPEPAKAKGKPRKSTSTSDETDESDA